MDEQLSEKERKRKIYLSKRRYYLRNKAKCNAVSNKYKREWYKKHPRLAKMRAKLKRIKYKEQRLRYSKKYYLIHKDDNRYKQLRNERTLKYYYSNKIKALARSIVGKAIKKGILSKNDFCCLCGSTKYIQAHHDDYNKPLEVKWVCRKCHYKIHQTAIASAIRSGVIGEQK